VNVLSVHSFPRKQTNGVKPFVCYETQNWSYRLMRRLAQSTPAKGKSIMPTANKVMVKEGGGVWPVSGKVPGTV
jgi:hypothetical protein